ncbi:class A beta-lactamase [Chitinophaga sp. NPDC101104]|uniref:class A beta-lactamase n=1 Tax=Chitinophaga sp. NPDC101104 TaxID=3390561 RepID=UPI003CFF3D36
MRSYIISATIVTLMASCAGNPKQPAADSLAVSSTSTSPGTDSLRQQISAIAAEAKGIVGVAIQHFTTGDTLTLNDTARLPMQSAFKFPIAMAVLKQVDEGKLTLEQTLPVTPDDLFETYSPLQDSFPKGTKDKTIANLIYLMVAKSDNIACDVLIRKVGGCKVINDYVHSLGVKNIEIVLTEEEMNGPGTGFDLQFKNWAHASAYSQLLDILRKGTALSKPSNDFLMNTMLATTTGKNRLPGLLPPGTPVAHKTGSGSTKDGLVSATNDAGIITLPNGQQLAVSVFVSMSAADEASRDAVIAKIARAAYDHYSK